MSTEFSIVAIDVGNSHTAVKTATLTEEFASIVVPIATQTDHGQRDDVFTTSFGSFLVGASYKEETNVTSRSTDSSYYSSDAYRVAFLYALKKAGVEKPWLTIGLPAEFFERLKEDLRANIKRWASEEGYAVQGVLILSQQTGPFYDDQLIDENGNPVPTGTLLKGKFGVIDIGYGTIDLGEFIDGKPSESKHFGESEGVQKIHKSVFTLLRHPPSNLIKKGRNKGVLPEGFSLPSDANVHTIDYWMRDNNALFYKGEHIDLSPITEPARKAYVNTVVMHGISELWGDTGFHNGMILAGGGAAAIGRDLIKEVVTCPIYVSADPQLSVVRGFYNRAKLALEYSVNSKASKASKA